MYKICVAIGTRPEAIKLLPVVKELRALPQELCCTVLATGQHRELADQVFAAFGIEPDSDLDLMQPGQDLAGFMGRAVPALRDAFARDWPDLVLVEGDTTTVFAAALSAFWLGIKVGHVEAGLRSGDRRNPFPEEMNRILTGCLADLHFAPTEQAAANLRAEGVDSSRIFVTGNTVVDALREVARIADPPPGVPSRPGARLILATVHRRESFGEPLRSIARAFEEIVRRAPDVELALPVHPNPEVRGVMRSALAGRERIHLLDPLPYVPFVGLMKASTLVLTDSGGVQEEAPALGKPVLVLRVTTERPEGVRYGVARLVGTDTDRIVAETLRLLSDREAYLQMARAVSPYGDGQAARRIVQAVRYHFGLTEKPPASFAPQPGGVSGGGDS